MLSPVSAEDVDAPTGRFFPTPRSYVCRFCGESLSSSSPLLGVDSAPSRKVCIGRVFPDCIVVTVVETGFDKEFHRFRCCDSMPADLTRAPWLGGVKDETRENWICNSNRKIENGSMACVYGSVLFFMGPLGGVAGRIKIQLQWKDSRVVVSVILMKL